MTIIYYPYLQVESDERLKQLLLLWGDIRTIAPEGMVGADMVAADQYYRAKCHEAGEPIVGFEWAGWEEIRASGEQLVAQLIQWEHHGEDLRVKRSDSLSRRPFRLDVRKVQPALAEMLVNDRYAILRGDDLICSQKLGRHYMSILARQMHISKELPIVTDDPGASAISVLRNGTRARRLPTAHAICVAVPEVYISPASLVGVDLAEVLRIRRHLQPLADAYRREVNQYQRSIQKLSLSGNEDEAWEQVKELRERIQDSFHPFAEEGRRISQFLRPGWKQLMVKGTVGFVTLVLATPLANRLVGDALAEPAVASMAAVFAELPTLMANGLPGANGFDYLIGLNREITRARVSSYLPTSNLTMG